MNEITNKEKMEHPDNVHFRRYAREWAMQFLFQHDAEDMTNTEEAIDIFSEQIRTSGLYDLPDKGVFKKAYKASLRIISGILENKNEIDKTISQYSPKWSISRMDAVDRNVMRIAVFEMLKCNNVPPIVSINEAVEIGKKYGSGNTPAFVNGILNTIKDTLKRSARDPVTN